MADGKKVLVIDDEEIVRNVVAKVVERLGAKVLTAANGYAQVEVTEDSEPIDLELDALAEQVLAANRIGLNGADGLWYDAAYGELEEMDRDF